jgi:hypothetical protein
MRLLLTAMICSSLAAQDAAVRTPRFDQWIATSEAMVGERTQVPAMIPLPERSVLLGTWTMAVSRRTLRFELRADGTVAGDGNARKWRIDGDSVFLDDETDTPMALMVNTAGGFRVFSADTWE